MKKNVIFILLSFLLLASCNLPPEEEAPSCTVYHYLQNIEDDEYTLDSQLTQKFKAVLNEESSAEAMDLEGFVPLDFEQIIIGKENNIVSIYYDRLVSTVTFNGNGGSLLITNDEGEEEKLEQITITDKFGTAIEEPLFTRNGFVFDGWDNELPESMPASDLELTCIWKSDISNTANEYYIRPVQKFVNINGEEIESPCWDYRSGLSEGAQIIIWTQKSWNPSSINQVFSFEPVTDKENTYYIFTESSSSTKKYYLSKNTKSYAAYDSSGVTTNNVSITDLCAAVNFSKALEFELIPVPSSEKTEKQLFTIRISGTDQYVTTGPSMYNYYSDQVFMAGKGGYESYLIFDSLKTDENGKIDDTQLFYLDDIEQ